MTRAREYETVQRGLMAWGNLCAGQGRHWEAELHYRKALETAQEIVDKRGLPYQALERESKARRGATTRPLAQGLNR